MSQSTPPALTLFVPFDLGRPLAVPSSSKKQLSQPPWVGLAKQARRASMRPYRSSQPADDELATARNDDDLRYLFGANLTLAVRAEASEHIEMRYDNEHECFPWGTNPALGRSIRISGTSGALIETWKREAFLFPYSSQSEEIENPQDSIKYLEACGEWRISVDIFACGVACLRLDVFLTDSKIYSAIDCATMLEYTIYGDARERVLEPNSTEPPRLGNKLNESNILVKKLQICIVRLFSNPEASNALSREESVVQQRSTGIMLRWVSHLLIESSNNELDEDQKSWVKSREQRHTSNRPTRDIEGDSIRYIDDTWFSLAFSDSQSEVIRLVYVLTVTEVAALLAMNLSQDLDNRLNRLITESTPSQETADDLRDVRTFAQIAVGLTETWRVSALDFDIAVAESRAFSARLDPYRSHISSAAETLYNIEAASHTERQQARTDAFVAVAGIISLVTVWGLFLALKDTEEAATKIPNLLEFPTHRADFLFDVISLTLVFAVVFAIFLLIRSARRARRRISASKSFGSLRNRLLRD